MAEQKHKLIQNLVPLPYRHVSVQPYSGSMTADAIHSYLLGKDSYRRTRYIVLEQNTNCAVTAVSRESEEPLFSNITAVEILALPDTCFLVEDEDVDPGNPSSLAAKARAMVGELPNTAISLPCAMSTQRTRHTRKRPIPGGSREKAKRQL